MKLQKLGLRISGNKLSSLPYENSQSSLHRVYDTKTSHISSKFLLHV
jgi:hypothetical protein